MVVDADGLNALAGQLDLLKAARGAVILTPHPGEMARLTGLTTAQVQAQRIAHARALAGDSGAVVATPDGRWSINTSGGPILGTGGTGDVLAGLTDSLLSQGFAPYDAARLAAFLHGRAGDRLALHLGDAGLLASELADELPQARRELAASAVPSGSRSCQLLDSDRGGPATGLRSRERRRRAGDGWARLKGPRVD